MPRDTLVDLFRDLEKHRGDFLVYDDGYRVRRHSYADVTAAPRAFATRLATAGITKGDKVVFWGENRPEWIAATGERSSPASSSCRSTIAPRPTF